MICLYKQTPTIHKPIRSNLKKNSFARTKSVRQTELFRTKFEKRIQLFHTNQSNQSNKTQPNMDSYTYQTHNNRQASPRQALIDCILELAKDCPAFGCGSTKQDLGKDWKPKGAIGNDQLPRYLRTALANHLDKGDQESILEEFAFISLKKKDFARCGFDLGALNGSKPFSSTMTHGKELLAKFGIEYPDMFVGATKRFPHKKRIVGLMKLVGAIHFINSKITQKDLLDAKFMVTVPVLYTKGPDKGKLKELKEVETNMLECEIDPRVMTSAWTKWGARSKQEVVQIHLGQTENGATPETKVDQVMKVVDTLSDDDKRDLIAEIERSMGLAPTPPSPEPELEEPEPEEVVGAKYRSTDWIITKMSKTGIRVTELKKGELVAFFVGDDDHYYEVSGVINGKDSDWMYDEDMNFIGECPE